MQVRRYRHFGNLKRISSIGIREHRWLSCIDATVAVEVQKNSLARQCSVTNFAALSIDIVEDHSTILLWTLCVFVASTSALFSLRPVERCECVRAGGRPVLRSGLAAPARLGPLWRVLIDRVA